MSSAILHDPPPMIMHKFVNMMFSLTPNHILGLPKETIDNIVLFVIGKDLYEVKDPDTNPIRTAVLPIALTCKYFYGIVFRYLYRHLNLNIASHEIQTMSKDVPRWGSHVRSIYLRLCPPAKHPLGYTTQYLIESILRAKFLTTVISYLKHLRYVYIDFDNQLPDRFSVSPPPSPNLQPRDGRHRHRRVQGGNGRPLPFKLMFNIPTKKSHYAWQQSMMGLVAKLYDDQGNGLIDEFVLFGVGVNSVFGAFSTLFLSHIRTRHMIMFQDGDKLRTEAMEKFLQKFCCLGVQAHFDEPTSRVTPSTDDEIVQEIKVPLSCSKVTLAGHTFIDRDFQFLPTCYPIALRDLELERCELDLVGLRMIIDHISNTVEKIWLSDFKLIIPTVQISQITNTNPNTSNKYLAQLGDVLLPKVYINTFKNETPKLSKLANLKITFKNPIPWKFDKTNPRDRTRRTLACHQTVLHVFSRANLVHLTFDSGRLDPLWHSIEHGMLKGIREVDFGPCGSDWRGASKKTFDMMPGLVVNEGQVVDALNLLSERREAFKFGKRWVVAEGTPCEADKHERVNITWQHNLPQEMVDEIGHLFVGDPNMPIPEGIPFRWIEDEGDDDESAVEF